MPVYAWIIIGVLSFLLFVSVAALCLVSRALVAISQKDVPHWYDD